GTCPVRAAEPVRADGDAGGRSRERPARRDLVADPGVARPLRAGRLPGPLLPGPRARSGAVRGGSRARPGASPLHRGAGRCAAREREVRPVAVGGRPRPGLRPGEACAPGRAGHTVRLVLLRRAGPHVVRVRLVNVPGFAQATCGMTRDSAEVTSSGAGATSGTTSRRASQPLIAWTVGF